MAAIASGLVTRFPMLHPLRHRSFAFLWGSQTIATVGAAGASIATAWQVLSMQGTAVDLGLLIGINAIANLAVLPLAGLLADRFPRERMLFLVSAIFALSSFGIALLIGFGLLKIWHLYPIAVFYGAVAALRIPATRAIYPTILPKEDILRANVLSSMSMNLVGAVGAGLGGLLIDAIGTSGSFAFQGVLGLAGALCLLGVHPTFVEDKRPAAEKVSWWASLREGLGLIRQMPWVWGTITLLMLGNAVAAGSLGVAITVRVKDDLHMGATVLGSLNSAGAAGALVTALLLGQLRSIPPRGAVAYTGVIVAGIGLTAYGFVDTVPGMLIASLVGWGGLALFTLTWGSTLQRKIPAQFLGRVISVDNFGALLLVPVAVPLVGLAVAGVGASTVLLASGLFIIGLAVFALSVPMIRRWE